MAKKLAASIIAATVAASMAIAPAAEAGGRGIGLGIGLGVLAVGAMAHQAQKAEAQQRARARAEAQARARAQAQAQARAKAQAQAQARAQAAAAAKQKELAAAEKAKAEGTTEELAEETTNNTNKGPSTYVAAPSSTAALTQVDVDQASAASTSDKPVESKSTVAAAADAPTADGEAAQETANDAQKTCKRYVPALGVAVDVGC